MNGILLTNYATIPIISNESSKISHHPIKLKIAQRTFLAIATVSSILSLIPALRLATTLTMRSVAWINSMMTAATGKNNDNFMDKCSKVGKVAGAS